MPHDISLITTIAASLGLALIMGFLAAKIGLPPLVGYLAAGIIVGPATPGFVADMKLTSQLAEIGVMLMMFGVGLHFSIEDLMAVRRIAVPGAIVQIAVATALGGATALWWGWSLGAGLVFGIALSVASTVVLLRALEARRVLALNPLVFAATEPMQRWVRSKSSLARALERRDDPLAELPATVDVDTLSGHVLLVGYGRVGTRIAEAMSERGIPYVVAEQNRESVEHLRRRGVHAVSGDASEPEVLIQAHVARASLLVIATADMIKARRMVEIARSLNPRIESVLRTHSDEEAELLRRENLGEVFMGEHELALAMTRYVLARTGVDVRLNRA